MVLVALLMTIVILAEKASQPLLYDQFFGSDTTEKLTPAEMAHEDIDTRLKTERNTAAASSLGILVTQARAADIQEELKAAENPLARARQAGWKEVLALLDNDQRTLLDKAFLAARDQKSLEENDRQRWADVLSKLDEGWEAYLREAHESLTLADADIPPEHKAQWLTIIQELEIQWKNELQPAFAAMREDTPLSEAQRELLGDCDAVIAAIDLEAVQDNTVHRYVESHAWFRFMDELNRVDTDALLALEPERVGFLQLYKQSNDYRGKLVRIRGQLRQGRRVSAPANIYGIDHYYLFWLKPAGGPNTPIVVYCLELPTGFPEIGNDYATLNEEAEVTCYFFQRYA